ncbi:MAG: carboxypeptidase-like regulatory domain-containing protein, partial [Saprospiraceae bacterium]|nr:carboxypeptidase-like regulatory domain-containing protein [Saprospiraceae bacterium]
MPKSIGLFLSFILLACAPAWSQTTYLIKGRVTDADTKEGLPFCNVYVEGTTNGVSSDVDGYYEITLKQWSPQLAASAIGYETQYKPLSRDPEQTVDFLVKSSEYTLSEVVVVAGENPANEIVRNIIKNKDKNSLQSNNTYQYESYAKVEVDLENIPDKLKESKLMKPFEFVFENIDSTSDEKPFLPVYITETLQDVYYVKGEGEAKNVLRAQRTSGTDNETIIEFIKKIHAPYSVYDNWIYVLEKGFISPFANAGLSYYEYYIIDSTYINGQWSYKLKFKPKRRQETTFYGDFWVADTTFAIQRVNMRMSPDVNINLVRRIIIYQEFDYVEQRWLPVKQKMVVDFSPTENAPAMIGRRTE